MPEGDFFYWASAKFLSSALTTIGLGESGYYLKVRIRYEFFKVPAKMILDFSLCSDNLKPSNKIKRLAKSLFQFFSLIDFVSAKTSNLQKAFHPNGLFHVECTPKAIP